MDWNNIVAIIFLLFIVKWIAGCIYGTYRMQKLYPPAWTWQDQLIVGPVFWIGWTAGTLVRRLVVWRRSRRTQ